MTTTKLRRHHKGRRDNPVAFAEIMSTNGWEDIPLDNITVMAIAEAFKVRDTPKITKKDLNEHIVK